MIHLSVGRFEIDWGKNHIFSDHSQLFQASDIAQVPYYYVDEENPYKAGTNEDEYNVITEFKDGLSKPLSEVIDRIDLLGYTLKYAHQEFELPSLFNELASKRFRFADLADTLATMDVHSMSSDYSGSEDFGSFLRDQMFDRLGITEIVEDPNYVKHFAGDAMESLSPYTILQLLARNPLARDLPVFWQFNDVLENGWARREDFIRPLDPSDRFLIVTEGSSDARILEHALGLLKPHIADFFYFVDMDEGYPFTGTGNLYNFTRGLIAISIQNNVVIIYDNDAEGMSKFNRAVKLNVPDNLRILKLPDLPELQKFVTIGPSGKSIMDINQAAAAIECYLDVGSDAVVQWKNFNKNLDRYHGELLGKRTVMKKFFRQSEVNENYDFSKITAILEMIIPECTAIRESARLANLK